MRKRQASKLLAELDSENGIGLIERVRRGLCKPDKIYVKDIVVRKDHVDKKESAVSENATSGDRFNRLQEGEKTEVMNSEIHITQGSKNRCQEIGKTDTTNNDNIKTYNIKTDKSNEDHVDSVSVSGESGNQELAADSIHGFAVKAFGILPIQVLFYAFPSTAEILISFSSSQRSNASLSCTVK